MKKVSVICPYNARETLDSMLIPSLEKQTYTDWQLFGIDTKALNICSAAEALNYGVEQSDKSGNSDGIIVFVHQDVELQNADFLEQLVKFCEAEEFGVGGVAGILGTEKRVYSAVTHDTDRHHAGKECTTPMEVDTIDECLFFVMREKFMGFDDYGSTWHLYAVEYSLRCHLRGEAVKIFPLDVYHLSPGWSLNKSYYATLKKVEKKYRKQFSHIYTTMGCFPTGAIKLPIFLFLRNIKHKLFRNRV